MAGVAIWAGQQLPAENIPVHWNAEGVADRFSNKSEALLLLWMLPGSALLGAFVFAILPQIEPMRDNLFKSRKAYNAIWITTMLLFLGIHCGIAYMMVIGSGKEMQSNEFVRLVIAGTGLLFIILGNYLPKTRQNWFLGITPVGFWPSQIATFFGIMPGTLLYIWIGSLGGEAASGDSNSSLLRYVALGVGLIVALLALFRPGPLQSGMVDNFVNRKHGREKLSYPDAWQVRWFKPDLAAGLSGAVSCAASLAAPELW